MTTEKLKQQLEAYGCQLFLDGDNIRFRFAGKQIPDSAKPLLQELKTHKAEVVNILKTGNNTISFPKIIEPGASENVIWWNPYPQGTPEARRESLKVIMEAMLYGLPPMDDERTQQINDMARDILSGKAKLADLRHLLGQLH